MEQTRDAHAAAQYNKVYADFFGAASPVSLIGDLYKLNAQANEKTQRPRERIAPGNRPRALLGGWRNISWRNIMPPQPMTQPLQNFRWYTFSEQPSVRWICMLGVAVVAHLIREKQSNKLFHF